jgi:hypothetical protein
VPTPTLRTLFPALSVDAQQTSDQDDSYNCIAWAAGDTDHKWWPVDYPTNGVVWPVDAEDSVAGFVRAFRTLSYEVCGDGAFESGYEKLALYVDSAGQPSHMARQLPSGHWTSKIGDLEDIEHVTPEEVCGVQYGAITAYMKRPMPWTN